MNLNSDAVSYSLLTHSNLASSSNVTVIFQQGAHPVSGDVSQPKAQRSGKILEVSISTVNLIHVTRFLWL
ncbi:mCG1027180 [Mus musculus]|nr:mCG1027180 [Mus musculus]